MREATTSAIGQGLALAVMLCLAALMLMQISSHAPEPGGLRGVGGPEEMAEAQPEAPDFAVPPGRLILLVDPEWLPIEVDEDALVFMSGGRIGVSVVTASSRVEADAFLVGMAETELLCQVTSWANCGPTWALDLMEP